MVQVQNVSDEDTQTRAVNYHSPTAAKAQDGTCAPSLYKPNTLHPWLLYTLRTLCFAQITCTLCFVSKNVKTRWDHTRARQEGCKSAAATPVYAHAREG